MIRSDKNIERLIINGIDFDKKLDDAKNFLHDNIDWQAQMAGLGPFFNVIRIETPDPALEVFLRQAEEINSWSDNSLKERSMAALQAMIHRHLLYSKPNIQFELKRI